MIDWKLLEIEPTDDIAKIKKAFAQAVKQHRPEDDAVLYQKIRKAYNDAIKYAKSCNGNETNNSFDNNILKSDSQDNSAQQQKNTFQSQVQENTCANHEYDEEQKENESTSFDDEILNDDVDYNVVNDDFIKKRENLFNQRTFSFSDALGYFEIKPIQKEKPIEQTQETYQSSFSPKSTYTMKFVFIFLIIKLIVTLILHHW